GDVVHSDRHEDLGPEAERAHALEAARRDRDNGETGSIEANRLADDGRISGKPRLPAVVAQHRERIGSLWRVRRREEPSDDRAPAEPREKVLGDETAPPHVRDAAPPRHGKVEWHVRHRSETVERIALVAKVDVVLVTQTERLLALRVEVEERHEPRWIV